MTVNQMREAIAGVYRGQKWKTRVARMDDGQVIAVFSDFMARGHFDRPKNQKAPLRPKRVKPREGAHYEQYYGKQMSIFDESGVK